MLEKKPYEGGCHCGDVRFKAEADLGTVIACNCSHCGRKGLLLNFIPADDFALQSGADRLIEYRFNTHRIEHPFCQTCGVQSFARGKDEDGSDTVALNVRCLDGVDPGALELTHFDGRSL